MREYFVHIFEFLTTILVILVFVAPFLFTSKGLISRKTLLFTFVSFVLLLSSLWGLAVLTKPSIAVPALICLGSIVAVASIVFIVKYRTLPIYKRYIERKIREHKEKE